MKLDVGALAPATIGGTICQAPVSGPAPVSATVGAEVEASIEGSALEAQAIILQPIIPSGVETDGTEAGIRLRALVEAMEACGGAGYGVLCWMLWVARTRRSRED